VFGLFVIDDRRGVAVESFAVLLYPDGKLEDIAGIENFIVPVASPNIF